MKLVIVESPTKSKTIAQYLGEDYHVEASVGHIRDLVIKGKGGLGVDVDNDFKPTYEVLKDKKKVVANLKKLTKSSDEVILATDPDREGEAIAWHLSEVLGLNLDITKRLSFHEITKDSILNALKNPSTINLNLVHSQEARRIIDRILGFKLSSLLNSKIKSKSAGRVQSVTLKLICDHENEILNFKPQEFWVIHSFINKNNKDIELNLVSVDNEKPILNNEEDASKVLSYFGSYAKVDDISKNKKSIASKEPFRTSTLQQESFTKCGFKTKETTYLAQSLYEGVEIDGELVGLITYMRTDSTRISDTYVESAKAYIENNFGEKYFKGVSKNKNVLLAQDAHECIRPTSISRTPESIKKYLSDHQYKLYKLIYNRTLASLMSDKQVETTTVKLSSKNLGFEVKGSVTIFDGYDHLKVDELDENDLPKFEVGEEYEIKNISKEQKFTKGPSRYNEAKIVKLMEEKGIGRPSTYSSTIQTLIERKYILSTKGVLSPTEQGTLTSNVLSKYFPDLMNTEYTAEMESSLDKIQEGKEEEVKVIRDFYNPFIVHYDEVKDKMYKEPLKKTGEKCPLCGGDLVIRHGRYGDFVSCSNYPTCKYIQKKEKEAPKEVGRNCPECGSPLVYRKNRKGQEFIGCSSFPKCHYIETSKNSDTKKENDEKVVAEKRICPECGRDLVLRKSKRGYFYGCSGFPKCKHIEPFKEENSEETKDDVK